jgi:hypothetical protein
MNTGIINRAFALLLSPAALFTAGCSVDTAESSDVAGADEVSTVSEALGGTFVKDGFQVKWTKVGTAGGADKIAACSYYSLWALNDNKALYWNTSGGVNSGWKYNSTLPAKAKSIACSDLGTLYYVDTDEKLYRSYDGITWTYMDNPFDAEHINSAGDEIYALNFNKQIYDGDSTYNGSWLGWGYRDTAASADRVTGGDGQWATSSLIHRAFALNTNNATYYNNDLQSSASSSSTWKTFPNGGLALDEITAGTGTLLYGLTEGTREVWKAEFTEDACLDNVDNDRDGIFDAAESECQADAAAYVCQNSGNGKYCFSRFHSENGYKLAVCSGGEVVSVQSGTFCTQVGSGGSDYVTTVK